MRVSAIQALETLKTIETLPQLRALLNEQALPGAGDRVSVAETAKAAIAKLQKGPGRQGGCEEPFCESRPLSTRDRAIPSRTSA